MTFTRRTHIVRVRQPKEHIPDGEDGMYVDIEVLDAISYSTTNGHFHIWSCAANKADPFIEDTTGDAPNWSKGGSKSTRGSHAKRILSDRHDPESAKFDIEVLDRIAFRDENGKVWVLDVPGAKAEPFCVTDNTGDRNSTRRTHLETIKASVTLDEDGVRTWQGPKDKQAAPAFVVERTDMVSFTGENEKKLVIKLESHDDGDAASRASTFCTPEGYDPSKRFGGVEVPDHDPTTDPNFYFKFVNFTTPKQPIFSASGWSGTLELTPSGKDAFPDLNGGPAFFGFENNAAAAQADAQFVLDHQQGGFYMAPAGAVFNKGGIIGFLPGSTFTQQPVTGGIQDNPQDTVKISMGPLWWVRAVYLGGGVAGQDHP